MKKIISVILAASIICLSFAGCKLNSKIISLSESLEDGETVWYVVNTDDYGSIGKDSPVYGVFQFSDDGTYKTADTDGETLGTFEQMSDDEIAEYIDKKYNEYITENIKKVKENLQENIIPIFTLKDWEEKVENFFENYSDKYRSDGDCPFGEESQKVYENRYGLSYFYTLDDYVGTYRANETEMLNKADDIIVKNIKDCYSTKDYSKTATNIYNQLNDCLESSQAYIDGMKNLQEFEKNPVLKYSIVINTDSTGKVAKTETIVCQYIDVENTDFVIDYDNLELYTFTNDYSEKNGNSYELYDSYYGGYQEVESDYFLLTKVKKNMCFTLDEIGAKNTSTDDSDSIFEEETFFNFENN